MVPSDEGKDSFGVMQSRNMDGRVETWVGRLDKVDNMKVIKTFH